jgi:hypothetical protein
VLPSTSSSTARNLNINSAAPQCVEIASRQNGNVSKSTVILLNIKIIINLLINYNLLQTPTWVLRLYGVADDVEFSQLADLCSQFGPLIHIQTEVSLKDQKKKTIFVELGVTRSVADALVREWSGKCRLNNIQVDLLMSYYPTINKKTPKAKVY